MGRQIVRFPYRLLWPTLLSCSLAGCPSNDSSVGIPPEPATSAIELHLLVIDDPALAEAIGALGPEWKALTRGNLKINEISAADLIAGQSIESTIDAIVYPSEQLGLLATRDWIAPLPPGVAKNQELAWSDLFELLQVAENTWGQTPYAVPFGSPLLTCFYRADLLDHFKKRPPRTWTEYHELAEFFQKRENLADLAPAVESPWFGTVEPQAKGWAGRLLLARAAAYAKHRDHFSTLFQIDSMQPLVAGPPFVRALDEMARDAKISAPHQSELDPAGVRREFLAGHAALAISWPSRAGASDEPSESTELSIGFAELPGSELVYNFAAKAWEKRNAEESSRIPLLCVAGRLGSVTRSTTHPDAALQLLAWLSGPRWGAKVSTKSSATTLYRHSQIKTAQDWVEPRIDIQAAQQFAETVETSLGRQAYLFALRIPGQERYLAALDRAAEQAIGGQKSSADALQEAANAWNDITEALGHDSQRAAYRKSLGLDP